MKFKIYGTYRGKKEEIDEAETALEAAGMASEYLLAYGPGWIIEWVEV